MKRDLKILANEEYDLLIIGAGIYGACAAWDASLRGLKVAIIDKGDFGAATSQNSLKTIHGGLRYLQQADLVRMRESIRERRTLMKIAPQFVHPLPCLMPTYGHRTKGREALRIALWFNDLIGFDRNRLDDPEKFLPRGRIISRKELLDLLPGIPERGLTGGALWYDCQTHNSERLLLSFLLAASERGAHAANHVTATGFLAKERRVFGITARDMLTGQTFDIRAKSVLNTAGPWLQKVLDLLPNGAPQIHLRLSTAMNLVTRKFIGRFAAGLAGRADLIEEDALIRRGSRLYFIAPWRTVSLAGTTYAPYEGDPDDYRCSESDVAGLLAEINAAYPSAELSREDVRCVHTGLLPMKRVNPKTGDVVLRKHYQIIDHQTEHGWEGLISILGVKYTTARGVAAEAVDIAMGRLARTFVKSTSDHTPVHGGQIGRFNDFLMEALRSRPPQISPESMTHLVYHYGSRYPDVLSHVRKESQLGQPLPDQEHVTGAEVVHAVREEMAMKLIDVIMRRTELGSAGRPGNACLTACADLMARELGWNLSQKQNEIAQVLSIYPQ
ncbi:MAG: glycerol-3-phosphate dehydrogenase/oxidase [Candidatus Aureabacteria bacterium]|nr:glycerol-3-phosphate dehydrogenase/oxidase [Candidatus Auribacterota bacterium]